jgi:hypothetical protein
MARPKGSHGGHLFDSHVTVTVSPTLSIQAHADAGFENTAFGRSSWRAAAVAARVKAASWLYVAGRADILHETVPTSRTGSATALFFPTKRVRSLTATFDARPCGSHGGRGSSSGATRAAGPIYFKGAEASTPAAKSQSTLTLRPHGLVLKGVSAYGRCLSRCRIPVLCGLHRPDRFVRQAPGEPVMTPLYLVAGLVALALLGYLLRGPAEAGVVLMSGQRPSFKERARTLALLMLLLAWPLGAFMARLFERRSHTWLDRVVRSGAKSSCTRLGGVQARGRDEAGVPTRRRCCSSIGVGLLAVYAIQRLQHGLPLNPLRAWAR